MWASGRRNSFVKTSQSLAWTVEKKPPKVAFSACAKANPGNFPANCDSDAAESPNLATGNDLPQPRFALSGLF
jgi:hypothetical protein